MSRKCNFCASSLVIGAPMNHHVRTIHPGEFEKMTQRQLVWKKGGGGVRRHDLIELWSEPVIFNTQEAREVPLL